MWSKAKFVNLKFLMEEVYQQQVVEGEGADRAPFPRDRDPFWESSGAPAPGQCSPVAAVAGVSHPSGGAGGSGGSGRNRGGHTAGTASALQPNGIVGNISALKCIERIKY